jgi:tetratricopeptide (TPR) repeat protein
MNNRCWHIRLLSFVLVATLVSVAAAQESQLGRVEFPTSGAPQAQVHFLRGLAALHSFWYEEALAAFKEATAADPDFMMGYWGQAMTYNHPLWSEQDTPAAREVIKKIRDTSKLTDRERAYLDAVKLLYGEGDKRTRDAAYSARLEKIYQAYPDDLDAAAFYALSLLGLVRSEEHSYRHQAKAGAIALEVYQRNPNHPGAAHYIIHAFDDPEHAILALPAARRYAAIAPEAHHARHMPSHIFLQLGMWPEAAASNESAWEASEAWMKRKQLSSNVRDYHSLHWLLYVYLQQGRFKNAESLLTLMKQTMSESTYDNKLRPGYYESIYASMAAAFVVETERWELAATLFPPTSPAAAASSANQPSGNGHGAHSATADQATTVRTSSSARTLPSFVRGMAAAVKGEAQQITAGAADRGIRELEVVALGASLRNDHETAMKLMNEATSQEDKAGGPSGPPGLIKPAHELFGEILLRAEKPDAAIEQFNRALLRQPNRARSLLGLARAYARQGNRATAVQTYLRFLNQWQRADENLPELREAKEFVRLR